MFGATCYIEMNDFMKLVSDEEEMCLQLLDAFYNSNESLTSCPPLFDGNYCWPATTSETWSKLPCPIRDRRDKILSRWCTSNTTITDSNVTVYEWARVEDGGCSLLRGRDIMYLVSLAYRGDDEDDYIDWWYEKFAILDQIGYASSIICLLIALSIFAKFSHLQDMRVKVHINLFVAMLLHAILSLGLIFLYGCKIYYTIIVDSEAYVERSRFCRSLMTLSHYFELTIFTWLLIEGWYFYSFISRAIYNSYNAIMWYMLFGWMTPLAVIIPWFFMHLYASQTNFCWIDTELQVNIIAIPIFFIILINLCFFILNARIIFTKLKSPYIPQKKTHYWRWIKSSLMLMPLFGTYDVLYALWPWVEDQTLKILFLLIVRLICCFQGCLVATLYCFTNGHVKNEIKRAWKNWRLNRQIDSRVSKLKSISSMDTLNSKKILDLESLSESTKFSVPDPVNMYF